MAECIMNIKQPLMILGLAEKFSKNGIYFYNNLFKVNNLNAVYRSCPINSLESFRCSIDFLDIYAASIAAPFKVEIIDNVDKLTDIAYITQSVNCIKKINNELLGHNTDVLGLINIFKEQVKNLEQNLTFLIYGTGGVVPSIVYALRSVFKEPIIYINGRNKEKIELISKKFDLKQIDDPLEVNVNLWINATPVSISNPETLLKICLNSNIIFDLNPIQEEYRFESEVIKRNQKFIRGFNFYIKQFIEQYEFFTDERINEEDIQKLAKMRNNA